MEDLKQEASRRFAESFGCKKYKDESGSFHSVEQSQERQDGEIAVLRAVYATDSGHLRENRDLVLCLNYPPAKETQES